MLDIDKKETQKADANTNNEGPQQVSGLGDLFKEQREKKGLSHEQVSEITRLRRIFIKALENEDWDNLPQPVFVRGFIKSYAQAIGLDEKRLLDLYEITSPVVPAPPEPLVPPRKARKGRLLLLILLLVVVIGAFYLWKGYPSKDLVLTQNKKESLTVSVEKKMPPPLKIEEPEAVSERAEAVPEVPEPVKETEDSTSQRPFIDVEETDQPEEELPIEEEQAGYPADERLLADSTQEPDAANDELILTGIVKMRTWIKICVDDQEPKEYIFQPGSRPQWKAKEGFYVIIGNAAGIEFDFNGKIVEDIGNLGQVVKLRLPEDFEAAGCED